MRVERLQPGSGWGTTGGARGLSSYTFQIQKIVSGGQTGVDRASLDWAIANNVPHGGWCPKGRLAVDGVIDARYCLLETESSGYRQRTKLNVRDSDATLILNSGALDGGTALTVRLCESSGKPYLVCQLDSDSEVIAGVHKWLAEVVSAVLNVAGPREEKRAGIYAQTISILGLLLKTNTHNARC